MTSQSTGIDPSNAIVPECDHGELAAAAATREVGRPRMVSILAALALSAAGSYVLYQRIGTTAQANVVEFTPNLAGGFLAVGMTDEDPGFIVLSALDHESVEVNAEHYTNAVAGDCTVVDIRTPQTTWHRRLRMPMIVLVDDHGSAESFPVHWSLAEFALIRDGADCGHADHGHRHRCGAPFADLFDIVSDERLSSVPAGVRRFLTPYARPREGRVGRPDSNVNVPAASAGHSGS